ncbi:ferredoxin [Streptomyces zhihengii]
MTWTTEVDRAMCMGSGMCAGIAPDLYRLGDEDRAEPWTAGSPGRTRPRRGGLLPGLGDPGA